MLLTKTVIIKWNSKHKKYYESKGYIFTKWKDEFEVKIEDLPDNSHALVDIQCDGCGEILENIWWQNYKKYVKEDGKYYCNKCANAGFKQWVSFYKWCYINLPEDMADILIIRWDETLNIDKYGKVLTPINVSYGSMGINKKGYWFKCLEHPEHKSEQKSVHNFTRAGHQEIITCNQCNSINITHPHLIKYFINKEDTLKYLANSHKIILMKCPDCGHEKPMRIQNFIRDGFSCPKCGDNLPYSEKFFFNFLEQLFDKENFQTQLNKTTFKWCKNYKYDFYIYKINCIIETMGFQHYEEIDGWKLLLEEIQENDFNKEWLARENNIKNYIILNCKESELKWIKNSVMKSKLPKLLNFKEEDIDWLKCHEYACRSLVKVVCNLWNGGIKNTTDIANKLKISKPTVRIYLKQGVKIGWCNYDPKEAMSHKEYSYKKVICLTTNEIFKSVTEASNKYNIEDTSISACCNNRQKSAGKHPLTNEKLIWMDYEKYINQTLFY